MIKIKFLAPKNTKFENQKIVPEENNNLSIINKKKIKINMIIIIYYH